MLCFFNRKPKLPNKYDIIEFCDVLLSTKVRLKSLDRRKCEIDEKFDKLRIFRQPYKYSYNSCNNKSYKGCHIVYFNDEKVFEVYEVNPRDFEDWGIDYKLKFYKRGEWINVLLTEVRRYTKISKRFCYIDKSLK